MGSRGWILRMIQIISLYSNPLLAQAYMDQLVTFILVWTTSWTYWYICACIHMSEEMTPHCSAHDLTFMVGAYMHG